eukprot:g2644.t1
MVQRESEGVWLCLLAVLAPGLVADFSHPAGWHSAADIARIRAQVASGAEPWRTAADRFVNDTSLRTSYSPRPLAVVCCGDPPPCDGGFQLEVDSIAAYFAMLRWVVTNDTAWLDTAARIIDGWSGRFSNFTGPGPMLTAGIAGSHLAQAAELLAYARPQWALRARAASMFERVFHPLCEQFCGSHVGTVKCDRGPNGNWDASCMSGVASWAVFLDNATMLDTVAQYYRSGRGNGRLEHYVYAGGQAQESGRDQGHTQDGLEHLLEAAVTHWKATGSPELLQHADFRLRQGFEYTAAYGLGHDVAFAPHCDAYNITCFSNISAKGRGEFAPTWELAAAVYGENATFAQQVRRAAGYAPEGKPPPVIHGGAHCGDGPPGQGTLTFFGMPPPVWRLL